MDRLIDRANEIVHGIHGIPIERCEPRDRRLLRAVQFNPSICHAIEGYVFGEQQRERTQPSLIAPTINQMLHGIEKFFIRTKLSDAISPDAQLGARNGAAIAVPLVREGALREEHHECSNRAESKESRRLRGQAASSERRRPENTSAADQSAFLLPAIPQPNRGRPVRPRMRFLPSVRRWRAPANDRNLHTLTGLGVVPKAM